LVVFYWAEKSLKGEKMNLTEKRLDKWINVAGQSLYLLECEIEGHNDTTGCSSLRDMRELLEWLLEEHEKKVVKKLVSKEE
jgi:hypothetical protein